MTVSSQNSTNSGLSILCFGHIEKNKELRLSTLKKHCTSNSYSDKENVSLEVAFCGTALLILIN